MTALLPGVLGLAAIAGRPGPRRQTPPLGQAELRPLVARSITVSDRCPACRTGTVPPADGWFGEFPGCSSYRACRAAWRHGVRVSGLVPDRRLGYARREIAGEDLRR